MCERKSQFLNSLRKDLCRDPHLNKDSQKKISKHKQFIKAKVYSQGGRVGRFCEVGLDTRLFWDSILVGSLCAGMSFDRQWGGC